ncbi:MAG: porin [Gammaproteobacteria bacterium]|nr:porin [Gammaproteobacteria bacterium]
MAVLFRKSFCFIGLFLFLGVAKADYQLYGQLHLSSDAVRTGGANVFTISSNATRFGFKGSQVLGSSSLQAVWKIESEVDATGEADRLKGRNRYLGIASGLGTIVAGYQDSPFRTLGSKVDMLPETIADFRSIMGAVRDQFDPITVDTFNLRAKRSVMYVSPRIAGLQVRWMRALRQFGHYKLDYSSLSSEAIWSYSGVYKTKFFYLGAARETHENILDSAVNRVAGGLTMDETEINFIYEVMESGIDTTLSRESYGVSFRRRIEDTAIVLQAFAAENDYWIKNSEGFLYAASVQQRMSKEVELYIVAAYVDNADAASFRLGAVDHGEYYAPPAQGGNVYGVSMGVTYVF